jgi:palmitoyltransferase ZDHHC9/14/18/palmitoyltransferase
MNIESNSPMNIVKVNLNNGEKNEPKFNSNINYTEINSYNYNKDNDNSGDGFTNPQEENEEEQEHEQEELSLAEIAHLKKIHEQTLLRTEKYANLYSPKNSDKKLNINIESNEKINTMNENNNNISHNMLELYNENEYDNENENDNEHFDEQKINPNKERIFKNIHCYFYLENEPLIIIGPDLSYFIWIFTIVSFFSILIYSLKSSSFFTSLLYVLGYLFFAVFYILLMVTNPGIPSEKKHYDINDLNYNYRQCNICNCIYHKDDFKNVNHCEECGICVENYEQHYNFATKCIGKNNKQIFQIWMGSCVAFAVIMLIYLIF